MNYWVTSDQYIEYYTSLKGITTEDLDVGSIVVVSWAPGPVQRLAEQIGALPSMHWPKQSRYPLYTGDVLGVRVSIAQVTIGAPQTIAQMETMISCGARVIMGLGWAGSLNPIAPVGSLIVPTTCIREEGTSFHYLAGDVVVNADPRVVTILKQASKMEGMQVNSGPQWTTDAIFRESEDKIKAYREYGVLGVDMETSAMFALGQVRDVAVGNLLVVSDSLWGQWDMSFHTEKIRDATLRGEQVMLQALEKVVALVKSGLG